MEKLKEKQNEKRKDLIYLFKREAKLHVLGKFRLHASLRRLDIVVCRGMLGGGRAGVSSCSARATHGETIATYP